MPGWHQKTAQLQEAGKVQMLGIIQEQNPERARLFMQWKQMGWPILVDTFNQLGVSVVPLTYAIDEHGIVRMAGLRTNAAETIERDFVDKSWGVSETINAKSSMQSDDDIRLAQAALSEDPGILADVIQHYSDAVRAEPENGWAHFRLAAAHRLRYDSQRPVAGDFQAAIDHWHRALELDPNNYIWRRRIQQYGPRLNKPYPFYDWIDKAQQEISARGEDPHPLRVPPTDSEVAAPSRSVPLSEGVANVVEDPDPNRRVIGDAPDSAADRLIMLEQTAVPQRLEPGATSRVHLVFRPNEEKLAHWNNETEPLRAWIDLPEGWKASRTFLEFANPANSAVSSEVRRLEFEIEAPAEPNSAIKPTGHALYYVCEDVNGVCLYRRQDFRLKFIFD